uniref:Uncharacterized protein n=1 Tax=Rhizophora mucronata TaxID=61149 RepID=A0A2P2QK45_RHIMU
MFSPCVNKPHVVYLEVTAIFSPRKSLGSQGCMALVLVFHIPLF